LGDYYLGIGVKNILRHYLPIELIAETNLQGTVFNEYYIDNVVNRKYDLLVIGGGGIIHGAHWPNGWFWLINQELIRRIKIPFIVYGVGYNYFSHEGGMPEVGKLHLAETIKRSTHFSVRNDGSLGRLNEQIGTIVPVVPDPGFHINLNRNYSCPEKEPFIIIQVANDKPEYRFQNGKGTSDFINSLRTSLKFLGRNYKVILAPHVHEDIVLSKHIADGLTNTCVWDFSRFAFDRAEESVGYYQKAEFVLAMRGHGQIIPLAFNTPVISLQNHPKHGGLMSELELSDYNMPLSDANFENNLLDKIDKIEKNRDWYRSHIIKQNKKIFEQTRLAFSEIKNRLQID
jgi:polysaccharide pyruvyl transferase WcaK-like protein